MTAQQAAAQLLWLQDMGADEILADRPLNRLAEPPPAPPKSVAAPPQPVPLRQPATTPLARVPTDENATALHEAARDARGIAELQDLLNRFDAHPLKRGASNLCFVNAAPSARVLVIVDRPRNEEDRSGKLLADKHELLAERMLAAIGLRAMEEAEREQVSLLSFMPWRPPGNRPANELECRMILPFAERAVALLQPRLILCLGALPGQWLAGAPDSIQKQRGRWMEIAGIPAIATFHPETLLKSPASKRLAWQDLLALQERLEGL